MPRPPERHPQGDSRAGNYAVVVMLILAACAIAATIIVIVSDLGSSPSSTSVAELDRPEPEPAAKESPTESTYEPSTYEPRPRPPVVREEPARPAPPPVHAQPAPEPVEHHTEAYYEEEIDPRATRPRNPVVHYPLPGHLQTFVNLREAQKPSIRMPMVPMIAPVRPQNLGVFHTTGYE